MSALHIETPLIESVPLTLAHGAKIHLKMEALQPSHSFKIRGIGLLCQNAAGNGFKSLVSSSGGNAGLATAYAGRKLGLGVSIFVPSTTSAETVKRLQMEGAKVTTVGKVWDEAHAAAQEEATRTKARLVHPFDDPEIWEGHSSLVEEIYERSVKPDAVILSVGGGGLMNGVLQGLHKVGWTDVPVLAVETKGAASFSASYKAGKIVELDKIETIATSLGARRISQTSFDWLGKHKIIPVEVSDREAIDACMKFASDHKLLVEPACGASLAVVYTSHHLAAAYKNIVVVVCGGFGVSLEKLDLWNKSVR